MSHDTYQSHIKTKRAEVIQFRNELISRFTNPLAKMKAKEREAQQLKKLASLQQTSVQSVGHEKEMTLEHGGNSSGKVAKD